jgi:hypothetical protein
MGPGAEAGTTWNVEHVLACPSSSSRKDEIRFTLWLVVWHNCRNIFAKRNAKIAITPANPL